MNNEIFGQVDDCIYVNSADSRSMEEVFEIFPGANNDGSVSYIEIQQKISEDGKQIQIADTVFGSVAIRKYIEGKGIDLRGKPYSKRHANELMSRTDFFDAIPTSKGAPIIHVDVTSLDIFLENNFLDGETVHSHSLEKARIKRHIK